MRVRPVGVSHCATAVLTCCSRRRVLDRAGRAVDERHRDDNHGDDDTGERGDLPARAFGESAFGSEPADEEDDDAGEDDRDQIRGEEEEGTAGKVGSASREGVADDREWRNQGDRDGDPGECSGHVLSYRGEGARHARRRARPGGRARPGWSA